MNCFTDIIEFFRSFQGESPYVGLSAIFVRFRACNLINVCDFCDTKEKMKNTDPFHVPFVSVTNNVKQHNIQSLTLTGGEPTVYNKQIKHFFNYLKDEEPVLFKHLKILIETNGFRIVNLIEDLLKNEICPNNLVVVWSPKFFSLKMFESHIDTYIELKKIFDNFVIKPVVNEKNAELVERFIEFVYDDDKSRIYIMPQGQTNEELAENSTFACKFAMKHNVNLSPRAHINYNLP